MEKVDVRNNCGDFWSTRVDPKWSWDGEYWDLPSGLRDLQFQCYDDYDKEIQRDRKLKEKQDKEQRRMVRRSKSKYKTRRTTCT